MAIVLGNMTFTGGFQFTNSGSTPPGPTPLSDQYFQYNTLLLDGLGTNGKQNNTFLDSSSNNFSITRVGNTTQGSYTPFSHSNGYWSNYFDGTGDFLSRAFTSTSDGMYLQGTTYTVEAWVYMNSISGRQVVYAVNATNTANFGDSTLLVNAGTLTYEVRPTTGGSITTITGGAVAAGVWTHVALSVSSGTARLFVNGVASAPASVPTATFTPVGAAIGRLANGFTSGITDFNGYISNLRVVQGTAVYTANFTPSTTPLTAIANTSLLTCQSNNFKDNSTNNFAITSVGNTTVTLFQPFALSSEYNSSTMGGSGYFDGSDGLTVPYTTVIGTQDFTVAAWIYMTATPNGQALVFATPWSDPGFQLYITDSFILAWQMGGSGSGFTASNVVKLNTWHHVAWTRTGGNCRLFVDGVLLNTTANTVNVSTNPVNLFIGHRANSLYFTGYMSSVNFMLGTALYTANYTPPTAPTTSAAQTQLLLNFTNAGIVDSTGFNDLETVGNAQISTTQNKWGGSSLYFDGSGDSLSMINKTNRTLYFGSSNWTVETWVYYNTTGTYDHTLIGGTSFYDVIFGVYNYGSQLGFWNNNTFYGMYASSNLTSGVWRHIAFVRNGNTITLYVNGTSVATQAFTGSMKEDGSADFTTTVVGSSLNGYMQGARVTKGIARYTENFTPPTDY